MGGIGQFPLTRVYACPVELREGDYLLCENKKRKNYWRAKAQRPPEVLPSRPQFLCVSAPLREKKISRGGRGRRPAILRGRSLRE